MLNSAVCKGTRLDYSAMEDKENRQTSVPNVKLSHRDSREEGDTWNMSEVCTCIQL